jgi:hypothetical protein
MTYANEPTLADRAAEIIRLYEGLDRADGAAKRKRIEVGKALIEAREHVPPGEWNAWCRTNIPRSRQDIARVMKMAGSDNPEAAHEAERTAAREGMAVTRANVTNVSYIEPPPPPAVLAEGGFFGPEPAPRQTTPTIVLDASEYTVEPPVDPMVELRQKCKAVIDRLSGEKLAAVAARLEAVKCAADLLADPLSNPLYVGTTTAEHVNALHRCVTEPLLHIGPIFIEFVKEHSLEGESIRSLHDALLSIETMHQEMLDAVVGAYDAQLAAKWPDGASLVAAAVALPDLRLAPVEVEVLAAVPEPEPVEPELDRAAPWKHPLPVAAPTTGPDDRYRNRKARRAAMREAA